MMMMKNVTYPSQTRKREPGFRVQASLKCDRCVMNYGLELARRGLGEPVGHIGWDHEKEKEIDTVGGCPRQPVRDQRGVHQRPEALSENGWDNVRRGET
jgi:hypothetical protein